MPGEAPPSLCPPILPSLMQEAMDERWVSRRRTICEFRPARTESRNNNKSAKTADGFERREQ